ncbi:MAG: TFIIB-type zinc ribbon-containing protein [Euryarchaeota archaeon]|nr:TFIIB-type zinc ribbon-containing protein [Euryarchaeota archaeon]
MEITACPKCGSKRIEMGTMGAGVTWGVTSWKSVCEDCGYQGEPLLFDSEKEYEKFVQGMISKEIEQTSDSVGDDDLSQLSKKDEEVVGLLKEGINEEEPQQEGTQKDGVFPENKSWRIEIGFAMILALGALSFYLFNIFRTFDIVFLIVYGSLLYSILVIGELVTIVIIEYVYFSMQKISRRKK